MDGIVFMEYYYPSHDHSNIALYCPSVHLTCRRGHHEVVVYLLERGARKECREKDGWTPLHWASA